MIYPYNEVSPHAAVGIDWRAREVGSSILHIPVPISELALQDLAMQNFYGEPHPYRSPSAIPRPLPSMEAGLTGDRQPVYPHLADVRIVTIGANAGMLAAAQLIRRGVSSRNVTLIDESGTNAGIWNTNLAEGGFNNPAPLRFDANNSLIPDDRSGRRMTHFLREIADSHLGDAEYIEDKAVSVGRLQDGSWQVKTEEGAAVSADYLVIGTGASTPKKIDSSRIKSNLDSLHTKVPEWKLRVERWQRTITDEELDAGRPIVLMGLGNSTGTMLKQIHDYEDRTGRDYPYTVLTDLPAVAVVAPDASVRGHNPIFRNPKAGSLTGYSGDLPADKQAYYRALNSHKIHPDTRAVVYDRSKDLLRIQTERGTIEVAEPHVFALLGYERDDRLLAQAGAYTHRGLGWHRREGPNIRASDGAVWTKGRGYPSNVFAIGAVAATPNNPNAAVIPGIFSMLPGLSATVAIREAVRQKRTA